MPKNKIGGSGAKKAKNTSESTRQLQFKEDFQDYALVQTVLGGGRMKVLCLGDNTERIGTIRGSMYKKVWVSKDDIVLISLREYQDSKCDIILKYTNDEVRLLQKYGEVPKSFESDTSQKDVNQENLIEFNESEIDIDDI
jgi:translation initiation factor 1A